MDGVNITKEVVDQVIDSMPEPSAAADRIMDLEPEPESESNTSASPAPPDPISTPVGEWISESDLNGESNGHAESSGGGDGEVPPASGIRDSEGTVFDPQIHATKEDGSPVQTPKGKWRKRRAGSTPPTSTNALAITQAAIAIVSSVETIGYAIGGDEWRPEQVEHDMMVNAWRDYFTAAGVVNIPPWVGVAIATGAYAVPRLQKPVTQTRLMRLWDWAKGGIQWIRFW